MDTNASDIEHKKIIRRLVEKALEIRIKKIAGNKLMHGAEAATIILSNKNGASVDLKATATDCTLSSPDYSVT